MFKKNLLKIACGALASLMVLSAAGCGGVGGGSRRPSGSKQVYFWAWADARQKEMYRELVEKFNETNEDGIFVTLVTDVVDEYEDSVRQALQGSSRNAPDILLTSEKGAYKYYAEEGFIDDMTDKVLELAETAGISDYDMSRFWYDVDSRSEDGANKKLYAIPKDVSPTVLYYNETLFEKAGVTVISVYEEDLAAFNSGEADARGKTKSDYGISSEVKSKGYFEADGKKFFNNRIAMSWDEMNTLAGLVKALDPDKNYGTYTEWWFNYAWSVGGDCCEWIPTDSGNYLGGYYDFTLMNDVANYIVADDVSEVTVNGTTYKAGEIIAYADRVDLSTYPSGDDVSGSSLSAAKDSHKVTAEVTALAGEGKLVELPSQKDAFVEFVRLGMPSNAEIIDGLNGYGVAPKSSTIGSLEGKIRYFINGTLGMVMDYQWYAPYILEKMEGVKVDVAPLPMYKEYDSDGNVAVHGVEAGHSASAGMCIASSSDMKEEAWKFIEFCLSEEGQTIQAKTGMYLPISESLRDSDAYNNSGKLPQNYDIFEKSASYQRAGDWWYLTDNSWISKWAVDLNDKVRNGNRTLTDFYNGDIYKDTFGLLLENTKK